MDFVNQLKKLPSPNYQTVSQLFYHQANETLLLYVIAIVSGLMITGCIFYLVYKDHASKNDIVNGLFLMLVLLIALLCVITFINFSMAQIAYKSQSYVYDHESAITKRLPGTNTDIITLENRHNDKSGKSGITIYYYPNSEQKMAIATIVDKKYHALNNQGTQYKQLVDELFKITKGNKYSLLKISDTPTYNLKMQFIYQNKTYQLSFEHKQLIMIKL